MKVLLCSASSKDKDKAAGGIEVWTQNIVSYYTSLSNSSIDLELLAFDEKAINAQTGIIKRVLLGVIKIIKYSYRLYRKLSSNRFDVIHLSSSASLSLFKDYLLIKISKGFGCKTVIHYHFGRIPVLSLKKNWEWKMITKIGSIVDCITVMDKSSYSTLIEIGYKNVRYLPNPLSTTITKQVANNSGSIPRQENKIVYVGHVVPTKGIYELVKGCKLVDNIELHIIGPISDNIRNDLVTIASDINNLEWLKIRGNMSHDAVIRELLSSGIFILPSYTEGFPNVILESMACGCSIIATPVGAIPEMLQFGTRDMGGLKVEVGNVDNIVQQIRIFLSDKELRDICRKNAVKRVNEMYAVPVVWEQLCNIWRDKK